MNFPLYRSQQRPKPYGGNFRIPVRHDVEEEAKPATGSRKVVQIPVHFVRSESSPDRSKSASKIQNVFRGFLVRKSVRKIMAMKKEVDEIEARVSRREEVELLEKDGNERLKVNEMLMALLFRLDSVRGVDSGVRDCRKTVIRKAIALQERVDAIAAAVASSSADVDVVEPESEPLAEGKDHQPEYQGLEIKDIAPAAAGNSLEKSDGSGDQIPQNVDKVVDFGNNGSDQGTEERNDGGADKEPTCEVEFSDDVMNCEESGARNCDREDEVGADLEMTAEEKDHQPEYQVLEIKEVAPAVTAAGNSVEKFDGSEDQILQNYDNVVDFGNNGSGQGTEERNDGGADKEPTCEVEFSDNLVNYEESGAQNCDREDEAGAGADLEMSAEEDKCAEDVEKVDAGIDSKMKVDVEACLNKLMLLENVQNKNLCEVQVVDSLMEDNGEGMCERTPALSECVEKSLETSQTEDVVGGKEGNVGRKHGGDDNKRNRELLERMMGENEKMMKLMTHLCERNEEQTRMLNMLTHRVETLEKAFLCDMIKRKKKKKKRQSA